MVATLNSRAVSGGAFQMTKEAIADNRYAADWLKERGFAAPVVIGHSNGGMLAVQHVADHPETPALVLLSAHLGGKTIVPHRQQGRPARRRPHRRGRSAGAPHGGGGPRQGADGAARLVVGHHGGKLSRLRVGTSRRAGARAADHLSGALHPRRQGACPRLSGRGIRRARRWAVRCAHRERLRSFLRRAGGHDFAGIVTGLARQRCWRKLDLARGRATRHTAGITTAERPHQIIGRIVAWHCIAEPC